MTTSRPGRYSNWFLTMTEWPLGSVSDSTLLTVQEVADIARLRPGTIYNQRSERLGLGALGFKIGGRLVFRAGEVRRYIEASARAEWRLSGQGL